MRACIVLLLIGAAALAKGATTDPENILYLDVKYGRIVIEMLPQFAPLHVARIKELVRSGFYDGLIFHRVIANFVAQGGDPLGKGYGGTGVLIPAEFTKRGHNTGSVNMARVAGNINSADTQFSIMLLPNHFLDGEYTVWGQVLAGMEHVHAIRKGEPPANPDIIIKMRIAADAEDIATCKDLYDDCTYWATTGELGVSFEGECANNKEWMEENCPVSCGICKVRETIPPATIPCMDLYKNCAEWATPGVYSDAGECVENPKWMTKNCRKTCNKCG